MTSGYIFCILFLLINLPGVGWPSAFIVLDGFDLTNTWTIFCFKSTKFPLFHFVWIVTFWQIVFSFLFHYNLCILFYSIIIQPLEIFIDDETKLTLHGLMQHYVKLAENEKNRKLNDLLDQLEFNQVCIFVKSVQRANELNKLLVECNFPSICIHSNMDQEERYPWNLSIIFA